MATEPMLLSNNNIQATQVRLILNDGSNVGIVPTREALSKARQEGLDLVAINQDVTPMVVKILDLSKYLYDQKKALKEKARRNRENEIQFKEIQLRPVTDQHDIGIKARNARTFLNENCKVRVTIKFKGRELSYKELGFNVIRQFLEMVGNYKLEKEPALQGNSITTILMANKLAADEQKQTIDQTQS